MRAQALVELVSSTNVTDDSSMEAAITHAELQTSTIMEALVTIQAQRAERRLQQQRQARCSSHYHKPRSYSLESVPRHTSFFSHSSMPTVTAPSFQALSSMSPTTNAALESEYLSPVTSPSSMNFSPILVENMVPATRRSWHFYQHHTQSASAATPVFQFSGTQEISPSLGSGVPCFTSSQAPPLEPEGEGFGRMQRVRTLKLDSTSSRYLSTLSRWQLACSVALPKLQSGEAAKKVLERTVLP